MEDLKTGDVVTLKSGSPRMTIESICGNTTMALFYNEKTGQISGIKIEKDCLVKLPL